MSSTPPKPAGIGPGAIDQAAATYKAISDEAEARALIERGLGRWRGEAQEALPPGTVPALPANSPWSTGDGFGVDAAVDINPADPSGVNRNRGVI